MHSANEAISLHSTSDSSAVAKLSPDIAVGSTAALRELREAAWPYEALKDDDVCVRVGEWRVIFYEDQGASIVAAVGHRRDDLRLSGQTCVSISDKTPRVRRDDPRERLRSFGG